MKTKKSEKVQKAWQIFFGLLQQFLSKEERDEELVSLLVGVWRKYGAQPFVRFGFERDSEFHFKMMLDHLRKPEKSAWALMLRGMAEVGVGLDIYAELKNLSPLKGRLLVSADRLGRVSISDYETYLAFASSTGNHPDGAVIAVPVDKQELVVF